MSKRFSASNAAMMMSCPASANLDVAIPNWVEPVRDEMAGAKGIGTKHHEMFEKLFQMSAKDMRCYAEMLEYVAEVRSRRQFKVLTEASVTAEWLDSKPKTTADLVLYVQDELHIMDPKTGKIPVPVVGNEQLLFYAACFAPLAPKAKKVTVHILQPWAPEVGCAAWEFDTNELAAFMSKARATEKLIIAKDTTFGPSDHCKFCPANPHSRGDKGKPFCPAMMKTLGYTQAVTVDEDEVLGL